MADKAYPSKPTAPGGAASKAAHLYNPTRPLYRPQPTRRRHTRSCCCRCCCITTFIIILLILLAAAAASVIWLISRPHSPTFTLDSIKVSAFSITSKSHLNAKLNLIVTAGNPNKDITFTYDTVKISAVMVKNNVEIASGTLHGFMHGKNDVKDLRVLVDSGEREMNGDDATVVKNGLKSNKGLGLKVNLETKVEVKMGALKSPKFGVKVVCDGVNVKEGKKGVKSESNGVKCDVDVRFKIWRWTF